MKARSVLMFLAAGLVLLAGCMAPAASLPVLWDAPQFTLTDSTGQPFNSNELSGKVWLVDFIYTHCPDVCPIYLSPKMKTLQGQILAKNLVGKVELLSLSVDPMRDTPAVLADYASRYGADGRVWQFVTGPEATIQPLLQTGFKIGSAIKQETMTMPGAQDASMSGQPSDNGHATESYTMIHSSYFLLVDGHGKVRATYDGTEVDPNKMLGDMQALVRAN